MKIVILGGVAAGAKAAAKARRMLPEAQIDLYTDDTHISYSACGLPYYVEGNFEDYKLLLVRSPEDFEKTGVHIHLQNRAAKILPNSKQVLIEDLVSKDAFLISYDKLIIAIGSRPIVPPIKNVNLKNVFTIRKIEDGISVRKMAECSKNAVIIGGGYIGIEMLEALVKQNVYVTLIIAAFCDFSAISRIAIPSSIFLIVKTFFRLTFLIGGTIGLAPIAIISLS